MVLRDYQIEIAKQTMAKLRIYGIAMLIVQVRVGKTLMALETCNQVGAKHVLFVTKKKVISSINNDFHDMGYKFDLKVTSYGQLHKFKNEWDVVIIDEFHSFGAYPKPSLRTSRLKQICVGAYVIMLSGTPTPESYSQFYHALWVTEHSPWKQYKNFYAWAKDYVKVKLKYVYNRQINDYSNADFARIEKDIEPITIRYTQAQAGFETVVEDEVRLVPTPEVVKKAIKILVRDKIFTTSGGGTVLGDTAVKLMMKVHQLSSGTIKTEEGEAIAFCDFKAQFIKQEFEGKKIAIFYKYIAEREHLEKVFAGRIVDTPEEFNMTGPDKVFICQIQSGREGINLSAADFLVMYTIDFSALSYWQARERMNDKNRAKPSVVVWAMSTEGIEQKIYEIVQNKKDFTVNHFKKTIKQTKLELK
jgi:hypothetical protein